MDGQERIERVNLTSEETSTSVSYSVSFSLSMTASNKSSTSAQILLWFLKLKGRPSGGPSGFDALDRPYHIHQSNQTPPSVSHWDLLEIPEMPQDGVHLL